MSGPTKRDREKLRGRVKTELRKQGRSQKDLEEAAGLAAGTLTRVFNGRRQLDDEVATLLCRALVLPPDDLFAGTGFLDALSPEFAVELPTPAAAKAPAEAVAPAKKAEAKPKAAAKPAPKEPTKAVEPKAEAKAPEKAAEALKAASAPKAPAAAKSTTKVEPEKVAPKKVAPTPAPPPPQPEERSRKRDLPLKALKFLFGLAFGRD